MNNEQEPDYTDRSLQISGVIATITLLHHFAAYSELYDHTGVDSQQIHNTFLAVANTCWLIMSGYVTITTALDFDSTSQQKTRAITSSAISLLSWASLNL